MKKGLKKMLSLFAAAAVLCGLTAGAAASEQYTDTFADYALKAPSSLGSNQVLYDGNGNQTKWKAYPGFMGFDPDANPAQVGIADAQPNQGNVSGQALSIQAKAGESDYYVFPTMVYTGAYPSAQSYKISVKLIAGQGGGVRIATDDTFKNYYELYLKAYNPVEVNKITYNPNLVVDNESKKYTRTNLYTKTSHEGEWGGSTGGVAIWNNVYDIELTVTEGKIMFRINTVGTENYLMGESYTVSDPGTKLDCSRIGLFAAGDSNANVRFTDFSVSAYELNTSEKFADTFVDYELKVPSSLGSNQVLYDGSGQPTLWKAFPGFMGFDPDANPAQVGIADALPNQAGLSGQSLSIQAKAGEDDTYNFPTVVYTGAYPSSQGYKISVRMIAGQGGGIRIATDDTFKNYYELYLKAYNPVEVNKITYNPNLVTDNEVQRYIKTNLYSKTSHEGEWGGSTGGVAIWNNVYNIDMIVAEGKITFQINTVGTGNYLMSEAYTVSDTGTKLACARIGLFAAGDGNANVRFTDFSVSTYDIYTKEQTEPGNVLYKYQDKNIENLSATADHYKIVALEKPVRVRKVITDWDSDILVSENGTDYYTIGTANEQNEYTVVNKLSNAEFRYIKVSEDVYKLTVFSDIFGLPLYSTTTLAARVNGGGTTKLGNMSFSDGADGTLATVESGANGAGLYIKAAGKTSVNLIFSGVTFPLKITPYDLTFNEGIVSASVYLNKEITIPNSVYGIIAFYGENGKLVHVKAENVTVEGNKATLETDKITDATRSFVTFWESADTLVPLRTVQTIQ